MSRGMFFVYNREVGEIGREEKRARKEEGVEKSSRRDKELKGRTEKRVKE